MGPAVRSASLLERRGFEPPVLFCLFAPWKRVEVAPFSARICQQIRWENNSLIGPRVVALAETSSLFLSARNHKEDRQFESPPLHQRVTANRRSALCVSTFRISSVWS